MSKELAPTEGRAREAAPGQMHRSNELPAVVYGPSKDMEVRVYLECVGFCGGQRVCHIVGYRSRFWSRVRLLGGSCGEYYRDQRFVHLYERRRKTCCTYPAAQLEPQVLHGTACCQETSCLVLGYAIIVLLLYHRKGPFPTLVIFCVCL